MTGKKPSDHQSDHRSSAWSEEAVEALLRDFYRSEMPPELREPAGAKNGRPISAVPTKHSATTQPGPQPSGRRRLVGAIGGGLAALGLLIVLVQWQGSPDRLKDPAETLSDGRDERATVAHDSREHPGLATDLGAARPVESRDGLRPVARGAADGLGPGVDDVTEWDIEVFPIDDPMPTAPGSGPSDSPAIAEPAPDRFE